MLRGHAKEIRGVLSLPDGRALSWSMDHTMRVWDLTTGESRPLTGHSGEIRHVLLLPDGHHVVSLSDDRSIRWWDLDDRNTGLVFSFDAVPTDVVSVEHGGLLVGDRLRGIHFQDNQDAPRAPYAAV